MARKSSVKRPAPMHPGRYIALRRKAAGLTRRRVADLLNGSPANADSFLLRLKHLEETGEYNGDANALIYALASLLRIDRAIVRQLAARVEDPDNPDLPVPQICRDCGCTFSRACIDVTGQPCHWVEPDRCSACVPLAERSAA